MAALLVSGYLIISTPSIAIIIKGKIESLNNLDSQNSLTLRLLRGPLFFLNISYTFWPFGLGYGNIAEYYHSTNMFLIYDTNLKQVAYMNGLGTILNYFGIIGLVFFFRWFFSEFKNSNTEKRVLLFVLLLLLIGADGYDTASYWLIVVMISTYSCCFEKRSSKKNDFGNYIKLQRL